MKKATMFHLEKNKIGDDSWLENVQDVVSKPTHRINLFVNYEHNVVNVKIEYDDLKSIETIIDDYGSYQKARAFYDSLSAFVKEIKNVKLEVNKTNVAHLFREIEGDDRPNAKRMRALLKTRDIELVLSDKQPQIKRKKGIE